MLHGLINTVVVVVAIAVTMYNRFSPLYNYLESDKIKKQS